MAFTKAWVETDPDGAVITVSQLDDFERDTRVAVRERLEGDAALLTSGVIETGTFGGTALPKVGAGRFYFTTDANKGTVQLQDGRGLFTSDSGSSHPKIYCMQASGLREVAYVNLDGSRAMVGTLFVSPVLTTTAVEKTGLQVFVSTAASAITLTQINGIKITTVGKGASSTINNIYGLLIEDQDQATTNFAILAGKGQVDFGTASGSAFHKYDAGDITVGLTNPATGATSGWLRIGSCAGAPTGTPATTYGNHTPMIYDRTNNFLYIYNGGWKKSTVYA